MSKKKNTKRKEPVIKPNSNPDKERFSNKDTEIRRDLPQIPTKPKKN